MAKPLNCISLVLAGFIGCATTPAFKPKNDYAVYPGYEADIALYNIQNILHDSFFCRNGRIDQAGLYCEREECSNRQLITSSNSAGQSQSQYICLETRKVQVDLKWSEINSVVVEGSDVRFNDDSDLNFQTRTPEQAKALEKAIRIYQKITNQH